MQRKRLLTLAEATRLGAFPPGELERAVEQGRLNAAPVRGQLVLTFDELRRFVRGDPPPPRGSD